MMCIPGFISWVILFASHDSIGFFIGEDMGSMEVLLCVLLLLLFMLRGCVCCF